MPEECLRSLQNETQQVLVFLNVTIEWIHKKRKVRETNFLGSLYCSSLYKNRNKLLTVISNILALDWKMFCGNAYLDILQVRDLSELRYRNNQHLFQILSSKKESTVLANVGPSSTQIIYKFTLWNLDQLSKCKQDTITVHMFGKSLPALHFYCFVDNIHGKIVVKRNNV